MNLLNSAQAGQVGYIAMLQALIIVAFINALGVRQGALVQRIFTVLKLLGMLPNDRAFSDERERTFGNILELNN